jgi:hypothetical protein
MEWPCTPFWTLKLQGGWVSFVSFDLGTSLTLLFLPFLLGLRLELGLVRVRLGLGLGLGLGLALDSTTALAVP